MIVFLRSVLLIALIIAAAPKAVALMRSWEKEQIKYRKRTVHEFVVEEGAMNAK